MTPEEQAAADKLAQEQKDKPNLDAVVQSIGVLAKGMTDMSEQQKAFRDEILNKVKEASEKKGNGKDDDDDEEDPSLKDGGVDLETLSRKDLLAIVEGRISKALQSRLDSMQKTIDEKLTTTDVRVGNVEAREAIEKMQGKYKDFDEWKPEILAQLKETPTLSLEKAYKLVRVDNPDKLKKVDEKLKKDADAGVKPSFGGLSPRTRTRSGGSSGTKMTQAEAVEKAWAETEAIYGDVLQGEHVT